MRARILVVEDNAPNLDLMVYLLTAFGHLVIAACDGKEGLRIATREKPDLILCDIHLPEIDGYKLVSKLKTDAECCSIPTVAVTALAMVGDRDRVLRAGFDGYVAKPIDPETFVKKVEAFLLASRPSTHLDQSSEMPSPVRKPPTILVVDSVELNLELACATLEPSGYHVITSSGPDEALAKARDDPPDLILSEVRMPAGSGYELIQAVKSEERLADIPFVFLTSSMRDQEHRDRGLALGANRFLTRPIEPQDLLADIQACLR
jgi:two-component system, cell cycle response regulator